MSTEIVTELRKLADFTDADTYDECWEIKETSRGKLLRAAAARLDELERENAALREALKPFADPSSFLGNVTDDDVQNARDVLGIVTKRRIGSSAALAGSGE